MAPPQRTCFSTVVQKPRGPMLIVWGGAMPATATGCAEQVAFGAATGPDRVGQALSKLGGHAAAVPNRPSRLAPQQETPSFQLTAQVNMSPATRDAYSGSANGIRRALLLHATACRSEPRRQTSGGLKPSCPPSPRPQQKAWLDPPVMQPCQVPSAAARPNGWTSFSPSA